MTRLHLGCLAVVLLVSAVGWADVIRLKDGTSIEGEIRRASDGYNVFGPNGQVTHVTSEKIAGIEVKPVNSPDSAQTRLQSLRHGVESLGDIKQVIERYKTFIDQNAGTPAAHDAEADLVAWRDRQARGLVKFGDKWVTPEQRAALQGQSNDTAIRIHDLIKQNQLKDAAAELDKALAADSQNLSLLYLRGVLQYGQEKLPIARKAFEPVAAALPDHAPTLNNLAVIIWRQKGYLGALNLYDRALMAAPDSHEILDNVAEILHALTPEQAKTQQARKLARHYQEKSDSVEKQMAQQGKYRWGATWVDEKQKKELDETAKQVKEQMQKMDAQFTADQQQYRDMDRRAAGMQDAMNTIQLQSYQTTNDGRTVQLPLPPAYFQLAQEQAMIRQQQASVQAEMTRLRSQARDVEKKLPQPVFTGIQRIIDADGMPLPMPPDHGATTRPAMPATQPGRRK